MVKQKLDGEGGKQIFYRQHTIIAYKNSYEQNLYRESKSLSDVLATVIVLVYRNKS